MAAPGHSIPSQNINGVTVRDGSQAVTGIVNGSVYFSGNKETMTSQHSDYRVAWICPLPIERAAAEAMLDEKHDSLSSPGDQNIYTFGRIGDNNVVIAGLPAGVYGLTPATTVANQMLRTFGTSLEIRLLVGIGGGVPTRSRDIRLGDVVVSEPTGTFGGVVQFDRGKHEQDSGFVRTGQLNQPPTILLNALSALKADQEI